MGPFELKPTSTEPSTMPQTSSLGSEDMCKMANKLDKPVKIESKDQAREAKNNAEVQKEVLKNTVIKNSVDGQINILNKVIAGDNSSVKISNFVISKDVLTQRTPHMQSYREKLMNAKPMDIAYAGAAAAALIYGVYKIIKGKGAEKLVGLGALAVGGLMLHKDKSYEMFLGKKDKKEGIFGTKLTPEARKKMQEQTEQNLKDVEKNKEKLKTDYKEKLDGIQEGLFEEVQKIRIKKDPENKDSLTSLEEFFDKDRGVNGPSKMTPEKLQKLGLSEKAADTITKTADKKKDFYIILSKLYTEASKTKAVSVGAIFGASEAVKTTSDNKLNVDKKVEKKEVEKKKEEEKLEKKETEIKKTEAAKNTTNDDTNSDLEGLSGEDYNASLDSAENSKNEIGNEKIEVKIKTAKEEYENIVNGLNKVVKILGANLGAISNVKIDNNLVSYFSHYQMDFGQSKLIEMGVEPTLAKRVPDYSDEAQELFKVMAPLIKQTYAEKHNTINELMFVKMQEAQEEEKKPEGKKEENPEIYETDDTADIKEAVDWNEKQKENEKITLRETLFKQHKKDLDSIDPKLYEVIKNVHVYKDSEQDFSLADLVDSDRDITPYNLEPVDLVKLGVNGDLAYRIVINPQESQKLINILKDLYEKLK